MQRQSHNQAPAPPPPLPIFEVKCTTTKVSPPKSYEQFFAAGAPRCSYVPAQEPLNGCTDRHELVKRKRRRRANQDEHPRMKLLLYDRGKKPYAADGADSGQGDESSQKDMKDFHRNTPVFEARFESGNLERVVQIDGEEFDMLVRPDINTSQHTQWYYFSMSNTRRRRYVFNIINFQKPDSLYNYGLRPLVFSKHTHNRNGVGWVRAGYDICYYTNGLRNRQTGKPFYTLTFSINLEHENDTVYFAYSYPYTYSDLKNDLLELQRNPLASRYVRLRPLCRTMGGNECDILTISDFSSNASEMAGRKGVVVTARVHPGETNASWMMKGFLNYITGNSPGGGETPIGVYLQGYSDAQP
mmetsp:Transcript_22889/g.35927  ORF Transcript_22889/g.35927 Transcript_22889/m.35927 type:complete len:357 (-) Transcript_22889:1638-2708(-)